MKKSKPSGLMRLAGAFGHSVAGFRDIWRNEEAFRLEVVLLLVSLPVAVWIGQSVAHIGLLIGSILLVIVVEILNTAIEATVDRVGTERHELSRIAKDLGSLAVFITALFPLGVWVTSLLAWFGVIALS